MKIISVSMLVLFLSFNSIQAQWLAVGENSALGGDIMALLENNDVLFAGGTAYLFRSTGNDSTWEGFLGPFAYAWSLTKCNGNIYCGLSYSFTTPGLYKSTDNGQTWNLSAFTNAGIYSLASGNNLVVASAGIGSPNHGIYITTDDGQSWSQISSDIAFKLAVSGNRIYSAGSGLKATTDFGINWNIINNDAGIGIAAKDSLIFFGTQDGKIYRSTDYGQHWQLPFNKQGAYIRSILIHEQNVFAGTDSGFFVSTDGGESFFNKNDNLGLSRVEDIMVYNYFVYVANGNYMDVPVSVWKRPLSEVLDVDNKFTELPDNFLLEQNYPNPFNGITKIRYHLSQASDVNLTVFDALGREVKKLVDDFEAPGIKTVEFDANGLSSGLYFYTLTSGKFRDTKKLILMK